MMMVLIACQEETSEAPSDQEVGAVADSKQQADKVKRGEHLVKVLVCRDCHTPMMMTDKGPAWNMERDLSGHPRDIVPPPFDKNVIEHYVLFSSTFTAIHGPWGTSYAANLTPHETGIGTWTEEQFFRALREGKFKGMPNGRNLLPPMPWEGYRHLPDEDISAIFAYLKSIKPVDNLVPQPVIAAPISMAHPQ